MLSDSFQEELALLRAAGIIEGALQLDQPVTRGKNVCRPDRCPRP